MIFDIVVLLILLISALHAFWRGFIREVLTILGAIGGVFAAITFAGSLRPLMDGWLGVKDGEKVARLFDVVPMDLVSSVLSYAAIFIVVFGVLTFISHLIAEQVRALGLGAVDRTLGVVFGLLRGAVVILIFYLPVYLVIDDTNKKDWFAESKTYAHVDTATKWVLAQLPENMRPSTADQPETPAPTSPLDELRAPGPDAADQSTPAPSEKEAGYNALQRRVIDGLIDQGIQAVAPKSAAPE